MGSKEGTSELDFICRQGDLPKGHQSYWAMRRKHETLGAIGWGHADAPFLNKKLTDEKQYKQQRGEFRQAAEDRYTHLYQSPWYPDPKDKKEVSQSKTNHKEPEPERSGTRETVQFSSDRSIEVDAKE